MEGQLTGDPILHVECPGPLDDARGSLSEVQESEERSDESQGSSFSPPTMTSSSRVVCLHRSVF
jgi:hypothetical protein